MIQKLLRQVRGGLSRLPKTGPLAKVSLPTSSKIDDKVITSSNDVRVVQHENKPQEDQNSDLKSDPIGDLNRSPKTNQETKPSSDSKLRKLLVFNSFTKSKQPATANGEQIHVTNCNATSNRLLARAYICGPTVYDDSHIGHAMTYLRFDLIRRTLKRYCSVDLGRFQQLFS